VVVAAVVLLAEVVVLLELLVVLLSLLFWAEAPAKTIMSASDLSNVVRPEDLEAPERPAEAVVFAAAVVELLSVVLPAVVLPDVVLTVGLVLLVSLLLFWADAPAKTSIMTRARSGAIRPDDRVAADRPEAAVVLLEALVALLTASVVVTLLVLELSVVVMLLAAVVLTEAVVLLVSSLLF